VNARCNISKVALDLINKHRYGLACQDSAEKLFVQHYLNSLDCNPKQLYCIPVEDCTSHTKSETSTFYINSIAYTEEVVGGTVKSVIFELGQYGGGTLPFTYQWAFDNSVATLAPGYTLTGSTLKLLLNNPNEDAVITVGIICTDFKGFIASKTCEYTYNPVFTDSYSYSSGMGCL
jgi:hypothetical protein